MEQVAMVKVDELSQHPKNPRTGNIGAIQESIEANGWYGTVVAQRSTGYVLAGNHRLQAAQLVGIESVPVYWVDVDDDTAARILLADNRVNDLASYNDEALKELLSEMAEKNNIDGTGWYVDDIETLLGEIEDDWRPDADTDPLDLESEYHLLIVFNSEHEQRDALKELTEQGYDVKASLL